MTHQWNVSMNDKKLRQKHSNFQKMKNIPKLHYFMSLSPLVMKKTKKKKCTGL